jgi:putative DNA primase/helicase
VDHKARMARVEAVLKWALTSESGPRIREMLFHAQSERGIPITHHDLDRDPWVLNVGNGTLDLRTGTLRPHQRDDLLMKQAPVRYDPQATCPQWMQFLYEVMNKDMELVSYLQRAVGYSLTGAVNEDALFFLYGTGANGKTTFLNTVLELMGNYGTQVMSELLMMRHHEQHPTERADLFGRRFVSTAEVDAGRRLSEALVKILTGREKIKARRMREDLWEFLPTHKIWLAANHKPVIRGTDTAIWRRPRLIPFVVTFDGDKKDTTLPDKLKRELPGILRWALEGCLAWKQGGLQEPPGVIAATEAYRQEMDVSGNSSMSVVRSR